MDSGSISNILREFKAAVGTSQLVTRWRLCKMTWKLYPAPVCAAAQTCHWLFRSIRRRNTKKLLKEVNEYLGSSMLPELANISEIIQAVFDSSDPAREVLSRPHGKARRVWKAPWVGHQSLKKKSFSFGSTQLTGMSCFSALMSWGAAMFPYRSASGNSAKDLFTVLLHRPM